MYCCYYYYYYYYNQAKLILWLSQEVHSKPRSISPVSGGFHHLLKTEKEKRLMKNVLLTTNQTLVFGV